MELFRLFGSIMIDDKDALGALKRTEDRTKMTKDSLKKFGDSAIQAGKTVAIGLGIAATAATALVKKFSDTASEISDASKRVGMSAEEYQKWAYAAKLSGVEMSTLETLMKKQQTAFADARGGSKKLQDSYKRLGIDISKVGSSSEAFELVMERLADMEDATLRNELANDLFGKSYADLLPLLEEGSDGIRSLKDEAVELGAVISNDNVEAGDKFGDTMDKLNAIFTGIVNEVAIALLPAFQKLADWVIANKDKIKEFAENALTKLGDVLGKVADWLGKVIDGDPDAKKAFDNIVWFLGAITAAPLIASLAAHPILALVTAIGTMIAFKDEFAALYRNMTPAQKTIAQLGALALAVGSVLVAATGGTAAIPIGIGMAALALAVGAVIAEGEKVQGSGSAWRPDSPQQVTDNAWQYGSNQINPGAYQYPGTTTGATGGASSTEIADAVSDALKNVTIQLDSKQVGKFVDKRILVGAE